jgi:endonuclease YncB( thermonuclease family)
MVTLWAALLYLLLASDAVAEDFSGLVISVLNGDTIEVLHRRHPERMRLNGIDCPEKGQAYGHSAKQATSALVFGKEVLLQTYGKDKYGHTLADVRLLDGTHVNHTLVKHGWCWWYRKYAPENRELERLEKTAREKQKGLWVDHHPVPAWVLQKARVPPR